MILFLGIAFWLLFTVIVGTILGLIVFFKICRFNINVDVNINESIQN